MILIVDDKPENLFSLKTILERNGYEVETALSGEEALKKVLRNTYSLIILDVQMPEMDGFEVAEALTGLNKTRHIPIIFLSAVNTHKRFITKGFQVGAIDYITKPVDPDILLLRVQTFNRLFEQTAALNKAHQLLENAHAELHLTLNSIPQAAFTARPDGTVDFVNKYWFHYSSSKDVFPQTPEGKKALKDIWQEIIRTDAFAELEVDIKNIQSGLFQHHLLRVTPVKDNKRIIKWSGVFVDIHEQKINAELLEEKVEERTRELVAMNNQLEASNSDLQQFASVASHDLKEPIRKIHLFSSLIKEHLTEPEKIRHYTEKIMHASVRMNSLVDDVLGFSRLSAAGTFETIDLNSIVKEVLIDLELAISEKEAQIQVEPLPAIEVIPGLMRQVFQNLISNALKFSRPDQKPVINISAACVSSISFDSAPADKGSFCRITVSDNGIGFEEQYAEKIFSLFQRLNAMHQYEGTGIGLSIVRKIVEKHHGIIKARGKVGKGADFIFVLPIHQDN